ncbi:RNA exonuclease 5 isoform X2 [Ahaetulla prasina]|uniref:RNA exonuclease 5 isoform X2 n=1 Tax=Ahaetulla prasina TaxID=499056 RepID=UPI002649FFEB|nr:RNA exonuclease 5 isoform X2 [Ahaetulla prasina]
MKMRKLKERTGRLKEREKLRKMTFTQITRKLNFPVKDVICGNGALNPDIFSGNVNTPESILLLSKVKTPSLSPRMFGEGQISCEQLCEFLKYAAQGKHHNVTQPSWCRIYHQRRVAGVMVVILHHVDQLHFYRYYLQFKHLRKTFKHRFSLPAISGDFIKKLGGLGTSDGQQLSKEERSEVPVIQKHAEKGCRLSSYILSREEMRVYDYPVEGYGDRSHFVQTLCNGPVTDNSPLFGLDCEMCLTDKGSELTQIAVVDTAGQCVMNELVKPKRPIRNYLTCYSGITEKLLRPVQTTLAEIQTRLRNLLPPDAILVGHSLDADLRALEMIHPNVIDTSLLYARKGGKRFKLKFLAAAVLGKEIQNKAQLGHDPTEDAQCALELAQYFIRQGPRKIAELNLEARLSEQMKMGETETIVRAEQNDSSLSANFRGKTLLLGEQNKVQNQTASFNEQILQKALEEIPKSPVNVIQLVLDSKHITADLHAETTSKMRTKLSDLLTVYVGPLTKDVCLKTVNKAFRKCGHIQTIRVISETFKPHLCIQYEVLEGAQLALEDLNGAEIGGSAIKVQRPITEMTLDGEMLLQELERDPENQGILYLAGLRKCQGETELQERLGPLKGLRSIFWPRDLQTGRQRDYCFLKFQSPECVSKALQILQGSPFWSRRALTSPTFFQWACLVNEKGHGGAEVRENQQQQQPSDQELGLKKAIKKLDRKVKTLYERVPENTLCLVLLSGTNRLTGSLSGLSLFGIKGEKSISTSC